LSYLNANIYIMIWVSRLLYVSAIRNALGLALPGTR
jgi:hypothetical protein